MPPPGAAPPSTETSHQRRRTRLGRLAHGERGGGGHGVGEGHLGHLQRASGKVVLAATVHERRHAGGADGKPDRAEPPRPAGAVGDDHADIGAEMRVQPLLDVPRAAVRRLGQQQHASPVVARLQIGPVDACIGHDDAVMGHRNQNVRRGAQDLGRLRENGLDEARILAGDGSRLPGAAAGLEARQVEIAPLGLETIFCATTRMSCAWGSSRSCSSAAIRRAERSSPGCTLGMPWRAVMVSVCSPKAV